VSTPGAEDSAGGTRRGWSRLVVWQAQAFDDDVAEALEHVAAISTPVLAWLALLTRSRLAQR
jgi:hypothetical protein